MTESLRPDAERIVQTLRAAGHEAYFAGGCVRDMVMGVEPHDYDIATSARPEEVVRLFSRSLTVGAQFGVVVVLAGEGSFEVATFRADAPSTDGRHPDSVQFCSAREDVARRDFTINGMLYDPVERRVMDWVEGQEDVRDRVIRAIGNPEERFAEDKLRLLRAVRFAARLGYAIEEKTYAAMVRMAPHAGEVSPERVRDELVRILTGPNAGRAVRIMHDTGLLKPVLAEIEALAGVEQPPQFHPEGDVLEHTCAMLDGMRNPSTELAMAVLLHDVGKPQTQTFAERIRFDDHDQAGAEIARDVCRRLRFSNDQLEQIVSLVGSHMRFMAVQRMKLSTLKRLLALSRFDEHLELHRLDCISSHGKLDNYEFLQQKLKEFSSEQIAPEPLVTGRDLIEMGYKPGPVFKRILDAVREEQLEGRLASREEGIEWIRKRGEEWKQDQSARP
ncbi:MAG: CCA tRNA nucleotidyltransferase [Candidatus Brocadiia bacterium]